MKIIDLHCDTLLKLSETPERSFLNCPSLACNYERLKKGNVRLQLFAIFVEHSIQSEQKYGEALRQIALFKTHILAKCKEIKWIKDWNDIFLLQEGEIGAVLSLEGVDAIGNDLEKLRDLLQLGIKSVGLTWNEANLCADGVMEVRNAGLTKFGKEVIALLNEAKVFTDFSHLGERAFWEALELVHYPMASHSNAKAICEHPRNLNDEQITALIKQNGVIGMNFYPPFLTKEDEATIDDLLLHIDHICSLGGENHLAFGSDFDGISTHIRELRHAGCYQTLISTLRKHYDEKHVAQFAYNNFVRHLHHFNS